MNVRPLAAIVALPLMLAEPAAAHHSAAMFDAQKTVNLAGTVKAFEWTNPHAWLQVIAAPNGGALEEWSVEMTSPNILRRVGWSPTVVKPGDKVTVEINPMRDGSHGGNLLNMTLPDGKILSGQGRPAGRL